MRPATECAVPPLPTSDATRARMARQRARDTDTELALRRELHRLGLRYRAHRRPLPEMRREADVVFGPSRVAVFVDGCFWHSCPEHTTAGRWAVGGGAGRRGR